MAIPRLYDYLAKPIRVIDGDSIEIAVDMGFGLTSKRPLRMARINAPELNKPGGQEAKKHLSELLFGDRMPGEFWVHTIKPYEKYRRYLADIYIGEININDLMVSDGHATYTDEGGA